MNTIHYYDAYAQSFYERTINANLSTIYEKFLTYIPKKSHILDAGCGVGRDTAYFLSHDYHVTAFDASQEMVKLANKQTNIPILHQTFNDLNVTAQFDAVWAQASLLHVPYSETRNIIEKIHTALKPNGIFYASYKYGNGFMQVQERSFYNMNEYTIQPYLEGLFEIITLWVEKDTRSSVAPSPDAAWLHIIAKKI